MKDVELLASECLEDGSFRTAFGLIIHHLVALANTHPHQTDKIRYFTEALRIFLRAKGGSYSMSVNSI
jgi:hypothetical protein